MEVLAKKMLLKPAFYSRLAPFAPIQKADLRRWRSH